MLLADIASGEVDTADVLFLLSVIAAVVAAVLAIPRPNNRLAGWSAVLGWLALALAALAWLVL